MTLPISIPFKFPFPLFTSPLRRSFLLSPCICPLSVLVLLPLQFQRKGPTIQPRTVNNEPTPYDDTTYSAGSTVPNASGDNVSPAQSPPTGVARSNAPSTNTAAPWSTSSRRSQTTLGSLRNTWSVTSVYSAPACRCSTARCELRKSAKSSGCGGGLGSAAAAAGSGDGEDVGSGVGADCTGREARVNRPWYVSCERVLSKNVRIATAAIASARCAEPKKTEGTHRPRPSVPLPPSD